MMTRTASCFIALTLLLPRLPAHSLHAADTTAAPSKWEKEISAFDVADREHPPEKGGIVFVGSSSIRMWTTLAKDFPDFHVVNRGFGGSEISDSVQYADRLIFPQEPRLIVMYAGGNDIHARKSPERVLSDFKAFTEKVRAHSPKVEIAYIAISPNPSRWAEIEKVKAANAAIEAYIKEQPNMKFIDTYSHMLGTDGLPLPGIFRDDKLHMNAEGYKIWTGVIRPYLGP